MKKYQKVECEDDDCEEEFIFDCDEEDEEDEEEHESYNQYSNKQKKVKNTKKEYFGWMDKGKIEDLCENEE